jgi:hypothetical protein
MKSHICEGKRLYHRSQIQGKLGGRLSPQKFWLLGRVAFGEVCLSSSFAMAVLEWKEPGKILVGSSDPCIEEDMNIFYAATKIIIGNGGKTPFWYAPLLHGRAPKDIAPKIFESSSREK